MDDKRANPDFLLKQIKNKSSKEKKGKLKIYLGAAPGVGKTYEMLSSGLDALSRGIDVVVGVGESHGRPETQAMLHSFEILPRQQVSYKGKKIPEFDLDGALKRAPGLILVDEMAHSNVAGSRHPKRWQDIKELLDRGINVCTTLNVQHIESLNDDVSALIEAPIHETVPDDMVDMADTIELVDLTPEDLLRRLNEGKVYIPAQIQIAKHTYFKKGNLIALRELALQEVAKRVNNQIFSYRQDKGIKQIWAMSEKILVCVGPAKTSETLVRAAKRLASNLKIEWIAVYVDVPYVKRDEDKRICAIQNLNFAAQLGAQTRILSGYKAHQEILHFAREQNVTLIMIWKDIKFRMPEFFFPALADEVMRNSEEIDVYIMTGDRQSSAHKHNQKKTMQRVLNLNPIHMTAAFSLLALFIFLTSSFNTWIPKEALLWLIFLLLTTISLFADLTTWGLCALIGFLYSLHPFGLAPRAIDMIFGFGWISTLFANAVILRFRSLIRFQTDSARRLTHQSDVLNALDSRLSQQSSPEGILQSGLDYLAEVFQSRLLGLMPEEGELVVVAKAKTSQALDKKEVAIANWVFEMGQTAGKGTDTLADASALFLPLKGINQVLGVIRLQRIKDDLLFSPENRSCLEASLRQIAISIALVKSRN